MEKTVEKILRLIRKNPEITIKELQLETGLTRRGVEYNPGKLKSVWLIIRSVADKGGKCGKFVLSNYISSSILVISSLDETFTYFRF